MQEDKILTLAIEKILLQLVERGIKCAIRRNFEKRSIPFVSDIDILIDGKHVDTVIDTILEIAEIVRIKLSYGGFKIWIRTPDGLLKELDFIWRVSKWGVIVLDKREIRQILDKYTVFERNIPILLPEGIGRLIFAEKTQHNDFIRYSYELRKAGLLELDKWARFAFLLKRALLSPLQTVESIVRFILLQVSRFFHPVGVTIFCKGATNNHENELLKYLFDSRIYKSESIVETIYYRNFIGGLVFVNSKAYADIVVGDLSSCIIEQIIEYLKRNRKSLSRFQVSLA